MNILITKPVPYETTLVEEASAFSFRFEVDVVSDAISCNLARISALRAEIERLRLIVEDDEKWLTALQLALEWSISLRSPRLRRGEGFFVLGFCLAKSIIHALLHALASMRWMLWRTPLSPGAVSRAGSVIKIFIGKLGKGTETAKKLYSPQL